VAVSLNAILAVKVENKGLRLKLEDVDASHPYLAERGICKETAEEFGIGYFSGRGRTESLSPFTTRGECC
jgi:hypothetical protein